MDWKFVKKRLHYAWFVCFGCALIFFCTCGLSCNVFSVYLPFIMDEFGYTKTQISLFSTTRTLAQMAALGIMGGFYKKLTLRQGMTLAAIINISGYFVYAFADSYGMFLLGNALVGFGYGLSNMVPLSMMLERWFYKDQTMAVSMCSAASGLATIGVPSVITMVIEKRGLRASFLTEGIIMVGLVLLSYLIIRNDPKDKGMHAFGERIRQMSAGTTEPEKEEAPLMTSFDRILVYAMGIAGGAVCSAGWGNMSLLATTQGYSASVMAVGITVAGAMLMVCKFLFGFLSEKITLFKTSMLFSFLMAAGTALLLFSGRSQLILYLGYGVFGGAISMITIGVVSWTSDWASEKERDGLKRVFQLLYSIGGMGFTMISGVMADHMGGSYLPSYVILLGCCFFIWFVILRTYRVTARRKKAL